MSSREKFLVSSLLVMLLLAGGVIYIKHHFDSVKKLQDRLGKLEAEAEFSRSADTIHQAYAAEKDWLATRESGVESQDLAEIKLREFVRRSAGSNIDIKILRVIPQEGENSEYFHAIVNINASLSEKELVRWMVSLHQPEKLRAVTSMEVVPSSADENRVRCAFMVEQWTFKK